MLSDIILENSRHYYRCNGRDFNMCIRCNIRYKCWLQFRGSGGTDEGIYNSNIHMGIGDSYWIPSKRKELIIKYLFNTLLGFSFTEGSSDIIYKGNLIIEGAFKSKNR